jgi:hypothetical protein
LEELASHGYVVAAVNHTFDSGVVEFPGGRVEIQNPDALTDSDRLLSVRVADVRFILDQLVVLAAGHNPDADPRIDAGTVLDGNPLGPASLNRPFRSREFGPAVARNSSRTIYQNYGKNISMNGRSEIGPGDGRRPGHARSASEAPMRCATLPILVTPNGLA